MKIYRSKIALIEMLSIVGIFMIAFPTECLGDRSPELSKVAWERSNAPISLPNVKLLDGVEAEPRTWNERCSNSDIAISQSQTHPLPNGIPTYTVEIVNLCDNGWNISNIHLSCGWFSSATLVNPRVFKRIAYNDCLVNNGTPLSSGRTLSFRYSNTFKYPLFVKKLVC